MKDERRRRFLAFFEQKYHGDRGRLISDTGLSKGRVSQLFDPEQPFGEVAARRLAEHLNLPAEYFERDHHGAAALAAESPPAYSVSNVELGPQTRGKVPLISWIQAGPWAESCDVLELHEVERWLDCFVPHSECTAALQVRGDSMTAISGASKSYPEGCFIFVDFEKRSPVNGQRIVAKIESGTEVTFKVFKNEDGRKWLQPLNPSHEPIRDPFKVLGTVIGKWEDE